MENLLPSFVATPETGMNLAVEFIANKFGFLADGLQFKVLKVNLVACDGFDQFFFVVFVTAIVNQGIIIR